MNAGDGANGAELRPFSIGADPALTEQVRKELIGTLQARTGLDPVQAERELNAHDVPAEFLREFGHLGLAPDNLPDLLAGHLMAMWSIVHDAELPPVAVAAGLVRQFTGMIATSPQAANPAMRQLMGEALMYEAVLTLEAREAARRSGSKAKLKQMAETVQGNLLRQRGINLRKARLTASGMMRA